MAKPYTTNKRSYFKPGDRVRFKRPDNVIVEDTVRWCYWDICLLEPYDRNLLFPALVLTDHSNTPEANVQLVARR